MGQEDEWMEFRGVHAAFIHSSDSFDEQAQKWLSTIRVEVARGAKSVLSAGDMRGQEMLEHVDVACGLRH